MLLGTASATLIGLLFVAISLGTGDIYVERTPVIIRIFVTPVYNQFRTVLIISILLVIPTQTPVTLALTLFLLVLYNIYAHVQDIRIVIRYSNVSSVIYQVTNIVLPVLCSITIGITAALFLIASPFAITLIAITSVFLLMLGFSNTWRIMTWILSQKNKEIDEKKNK